MCQKRRKGKKAEASTVGYRKDGTYTTTITLSGMSFESNVDAGDITLVTAASETYDTLKSEASDEGETSTETEESRPPSNVEITSVTRKDENTLEVSFVDSDSEKHVSGYVVKLAADSIGEKEDVSACVSVNVEKNITCDTENVTPDTKTVKLTMNLEDDNFSSDVTADHITLAGSFEGMTISSVSAAGNNLTLQLTGDIAFNEASGCYTDGFVYIDKDGFENGYADSSVSIGVNNVAAMADSTTFAVEDGTASFDINLCWDSFADKASASDFALDGAVVTAFEKKDDATGTLSFTVDGKSTANEISDAIFGKTLTIAGTALNGGEELVESVGITQASFYPVYDYAEESDGTYTITLILYALDGTFTSELSDDQISFADDFADAEISSLTRDPAGEYQAAVMKIKDLLPTIYSWLNTKDITVTDALSNFDTLCTYKYNFDAQSLSLRENYRVTILGYLLRAEATLSAYYLSAEPGSNMDLAFRESLGVAQNRVNQCYAILEGNQPQLEKDSEGNEIMYMYATGKKFRYAIYTIEYAKGFDGDRFLSEVANLGLNNNSEGLQEFLKRMEGRTVREELRLLGLSDEININLILLDNTCKAKKYADMEHLNYPHALCTEGFSETMNPPTTGVTNYGLYAGYSNLDTVDIDFSKETDRNHFTKLVNTKGSLFTDCAGLCDLDNYFLYVMYYFTPA